MIPDPQMRPEWIPRALAATAFLLHAAVAGRYDSFRDELYFIVCARGLKTPLPELWPTLRHVD
jgi:hypothetical protein